MYTKPIARTLLILSIFWIPASLIINPGWLSFLLFSPFVLLTLLPLIVWLADRVEFPGGVTRLGIAMRYFFYLAWFLIGFFWVNGGDTDASTHSIFTHLLGKSGLGPLTDLSSTLGTISMYAAVVALVLLGLRAMLLETRKSTPKST